MRDTNGPATYPEPTPPLEAYGRVTNPERFTYLHTSAAELLEQLACEFDVDRVDAFGLDPELERDCVLAAATVRLAPRAPGAAPIVIAFSTFPGLRVRFGKWCTMAFPSCGCDACDETAESETARLNSLIDSLIAGRFREAIRDSDAGGVWEESEFTSVVGHVQVRSQRQVTAGDRSSYEWKPWPKRLRSTSP
jgi:hypothetical protein